MSDSIALLGSLAAWGGCRIVRPLEGGYRNKVYLALRGKERLVVKTTRRTEAALNWLADIQEAAREAGFVVPEFVLSDAGEIVVDGVTVETYIEGDVLSDVDLKEVVPLIKSFHARSEGVSQRPGFASAKDLLTRERGGDVDLSRMPPELVKACCKAWRHVAHLPQTAIHGDLNRSNMLKTARGDIALLDWDEARVDAPFFDIGVLLGNGLRARDKQILTAWEVAVSWQIEPEHARRQAQLLL